MLPRALLLNKQKRVGKKNNSSRIFHSKRTEEYSSKQTNKHMVGDPSLEHVPGRTAHCGLPWTLTFRSLAFFRAGRLVFTDCIGRHLCPVVSSYSQWNTEEKNENKLFLQLAFFLQERGTYHRAGSHLTTDPVRPSMQPSLPMRSKNSSLLLWDKGSSWYPAHTFENRSGISFLKMLYIANLKMLLPDRA